MLKYGDGITACVRLRVGRCRGWVLRAGPPVPAGGRSPPVSVARWAGPGNVAHQGHFTGNTGPAPIKTSAM